MNEERKRKILEELIKNQNFRTEVHEDEFTKSELVAEHNLTRSQAEVMIQSLLANGKIIGRPAMRKGKPCTAYTFVEK